MTKMRREMLLPESLGKEHTKMSEVLCGASSYDEKYYFNPKFGELPEEVKKELQIMCVMFTAQVGGIITLEYEDDGELNFVVTNTEGDLLFDEIGSGLKVKALREEKRELLEGLELYYRIKYLGGTNE